MEDFKPLLRSLGETVRSRRKGLGLSRRDLALQTQISERFLAEIEMGRANPSLVNFCRLAAALGTGPDALLTSIANTFPIGDDRRMVALLGLRGAGKSTLGPLLAARMGWRFVELDERVEAAAGFSLQEIFELHGEDYYRRQERETLAAILSEGIPTVLATGGGLVTAKETYALLKSCAHTVWLKATPEDHWNRVVAQGDTRPMADNDEAFAHLRVILRERERLYQQAEVTLETSGQSPDEIARRLSTRFAVCTPSESAS